MATNTWSFAGETVINPKAAPLEPADQGIRWTPERAQSVLASKILKHVVVVFKAAAIILSVLLAFVFVFAGAIMMYTDYFYLMFVPYAIGFLQLGGVLKMLGAFSRPDYEGLS